MARDRIVPAGAGIYVWVPAIAGAWLGLLIVWPRQTLLALAVCAVGAVVFYRLAAPQSEPTPPSWVNDGGFQHVHRIGRAEAES